MDALINVPGLLTLTELVASIIDRFGATHPRLKMTSEKEIKEPTSDFVVTVYIEYLRTLKIDLTVTVEQTKKFEYPDAYMDAMPMINILSALRKFFVRQNANDFSMLDLVSPTFKRTYGGIAVMENYINFWQVQQEELSPNIDAILGKINSFQTVRELKNKLTAEANKKAAARSQRADKVANLNLLLAATKIAVNELTAVVDKKASEEANLSKMLKEEKIKTNTLKIKIQQLEENLQDEENLVVPDPGGIERADAMKKESLMLMNEQIARIKESLDMSQKGIQVFEQMFEITFHLQKYMETSRKLKTVIDEESLLSNKEGTQEMHGIETKSKRDDLMKKKAIVNRLKENLSSEKAKADNKLKTMEKTIQQLEIDQAELDKKNVVNSQTCKELQPLIKELQKQAQKWIDIKIRCEASVAEKKYHLDEKMKREVAEIDKTLDKVHATAEALNAKVTKELLEAKKLLNEQKAKDTAEDRAYKP